MAYRGPAGDQRPLSACRAYARRANEASGCRLVDRFKPSLPVILGPEHEVPLPALSHAKALAERSRTGACGGVLAHAGALCGMGRRVGRTGPEGERQGNAEWVPRSLSFLVFRSRKPQLPVVVLL